MQDPRDIELPNIVASIRDPDPVRALDRVLEQTHFWPTLEAARESAGKSKQDLLICLKPNFMMAIRREDPPLVYTDPTLVEHWLGLLRDRGYTNLRVVEAQNVYGLWYHNRSVEHVAEVLGFSSQGYDIHNLTTEQYPYDYGGEFGESFVGASWRDADFRISFAKNKTHDVAGCTLVIKNTYGCLPEQDKFTEYHKKREVDICTVQALTHFPIHFAAIDASWSLDGPLGYKEGFDVLRDANGRVIREGNIHHTQTIIGGRDFLAVEKVGMLKMGIDPEKDKRFYGGARKVFGEREFDWVGDRSTYDGWLNVGWATSEMLDIGEELNTMSHFLGESMAHVDTDLFPLRKNTWFHRLMHKIGRRSFLKKVRSRKGIRVIPTAYAEDQPPGRPVNA